jgi:hypothetical protein
VGSSDAPEKSPALAVGRLGRLGRSTVVTGETKLVALQRSSRSARLPSTVLVLTTSAISYVCVGSWIGAL